MPPLTHNTDIHAPTTATPIYVPPTYPWPVSTRLVLMRLPVRSQSATEDQNTFALQLFSECHLRLHYICATNLCMLGLNKACTNAAARSQPVDDRGSKRICTTTIFRMPPTPTLYMCCKPIAWSVSTRLVLTRLPVPSPSTTKDQNASALQLFSESHLSLQSPTVLAFRFPLHVVVLPPAEHTGFSLMVLPNHCLCNAILAN